MVEEILWYEGVGEVAEGTGRGEPQSESSWLWNEHMDKQMPQVVLRKALGSAKVRDRANYLQAAYGMSGRRACQMPTLGRITNRYESKAD